MTDGHGICYNEHISGVCPALSFFRKPWQAVGIMLLTLFDGRGMVRQHPKALFFSSTTSVGAPSKSKRSACDGAFTERVYPASPDPWVEVRTTRVTPATRRRHEGEDLSGRLAGVVNGPPRSNPRRAAQFSEEDLFQFIKRLIPKPRINVFQTRALLFDFFIQNSFQNPKHILKIIIAVKKYFKSLVRLHSYLTRGLGR